MKKILLIGPDFNPQGAVWISVAKMGRARRYRGGGLTRLLHHLGAGEI